MVRKRNWKQSAYRMPFTNSETDIEQDINQIYCNGTPFNICNWFFSVFKSFHRHCGFSRFILHMNKKALFIYFCVSLC